jgi:hypothetical protein
MGSSIIFILILSKRLDKGKLTLVKYLIMDKSLREAVRPPGPGRIPEKKEGVVDIKACRRCGGKVMTEEFLGETEFVCLQCGQRTFAPTPQLPRYRIVRRRPQPVKRAA